MLRTLDIAERALILIAFVGFALANYQSHHWWNTLILVSEAMTVGFLLFRRSTQSVSLLPLDWALAMGGTMLGVFARPGGESAIPEAAGVAVVVAGTLIALAAKVSLNRRFGIGPANRGVQPSGTYALVRHPMYAGYIVAQAGYLALNPTAYNAGIYAAAWLCQIGRIGREEAWLRGDPAYCDYTRNVRYRLIPGLY